MHVIIFSIDKNYELYQELEEGERNGGIWIKKNFFAIKELNPPCPLKKGESHHWHLKNFSIKSRN